MKNNTTGLTQGLEGLQLEEVRHSGLTQGMDGMRLVEKQGETEMSQGEIDFPQLGELLPDLQGERGGEEVG